ncbi:hypothetical protein CFP71_09900 [Amycolatopsis thailandensis]|uniref:Uncharacterized protein n=1 Tax=Amycolatopsis thailandensis TaxID=589330 RepID=A0A229SE82_9PSEU|nr:hypothetical protein [Amycolatopsis thailandensis]OXM57039.1 hypothetical protein CFP71_09900 [Amycolatopsis thailandensis]
MALHRLSNSPSDVVLSLWAHLLIAVGDKVTAITRHPVGTSRMRRGGRGTEPAPQLDADIKSGVDSGEYTVKLHDQLPSHNRTVVEPNACGRCGIPERHHVTRAGTDGLHTWRAPTDALRKARMRARREGAPAPWEFNIW